MSDKTECLTKSFVNCVYHAYKNAWKAFIGEKNCKIDFCNSFDNYAVQIVKNNKTYGYIQQNKFLFHKKR